jgi:hypothetical protein
MILSAQIMAPCQPEFAQYTVHGKMPVNSNVPIAGAAKANFGQGPIVQSYPRNVIFSNGQFVETHEQKTFER